MSHDFETLGLTELVRLRDQISHVLQRRFGRMLAIAFSDVVGSTAYFARFGNEAGRGLQQRHYDALQQAIAPYGGRVVDTAGDGAFTSYPTAEAALDALVELQKIVLQENASRAPDQHLKLRVGIHYGQVLTDGAVVTGDSVNLASRVMSSCEAGELRISKAAFTELPNRHRVLCRSIGPVALKGISVPIEMMIVDWQDPSTFPNYVRIEETGLAFPLPPKETITFGRLREYEGHAANDIVLELPDARKTMLISRWQFEVRRHPDGMTLRTLSEQLTEVEGEVVPKGQEVRIRPGSIVRIGNVITLTFVNDQRSRGSETAVIDDTQRS
jgi:class 3 adenylate cyclase